MNVSSNENKFGFKNFTNLNVYLAVSYTHLSKYINLSSQCQMYFHITNIILILKSNSHKIDKNFLKVSFLEAVIEILCLLYL